MSNPTLRAAALLAAIALAALPPLPLRADTPAPPSIDEQYLNVLHVMKHPQATGILVTEIGPDSPAGAAGLQAGDIIYHFAGSTVHDLQTLRQLVADNFVAQMAAPPQDADQKVLLGVHRGGEDVILRVPREPLGIRAIEVDAGVCAPFNPPPSPRGSIALAWDDLIKNQIPTAAGESAFFRINDVPPPTTTAPAAPEPTWLGWQHRTLTVGDDALLGQLDTYHVTPDDPSSRIASSESLRFRLRTGDYATAPAFLLESLDAQIDNGDDSTTHMTADRAGDRLRTQTTISAPTRIVGPIKRELDCPTNALLTAAVPVLAAALPHQPNAALALSLLSIRDGLSRPGYLLITRARQTINSNDSAKYWRVDLLHCGIIAESYWFTDQRRLVQVETPSGSTLLARRVNSQAEASVAVTPATEPAPANRP